MQLLGFDVDVLNTVQLSNHTAYKVFPGDRYDGDLIRKLTGGLEENGLLDKVSHVLTGYLGAASMLPAIAEVVKKVKAKNPEALFGSLDRREGLSTWLDRHFDSLSSTHATQFWIQ